MRLQDNINKTYTPKKAIFLPENFGIFSWNLSIPFNLIVNAPLQRYLTKSLILGYEV